MDGEKQNCFFGGGGLLARGGKKGVPTLPSEGGGRAFEGSSRGGRKKSGEPYKDAKGVKNRDRQGHQK